MDAFRTAVRARRHAVIAAVAVIVLGLSACESVVVARVNATRSDVALVGLTNSAHLTEAARTHAQQMCDDGAVTGSPDLDAAYGDEPATALDELVGAAPLDPTIEDWGARNGAATDDIWAQWADDPRLVEARWDSIGVGEVECADGNLYSTLVLRDDLPGIGQPGDTSQIELVSSVTTGGFRFQYFRNRSYGCSISGYQTFVVGTRVGSDPTATRPLWVKMHGGGVGYFGSDGLPKPASHKSEESRAALLGNVDDGLMTDVMAAPEGFRVVIVSMCSHDAYAGADTTDLNNPNTLPDGTPRTTNGLLATKAAVAHATATYPTDDVFLHGGSAGSAGSFHVAWGLEEEGLAPAGVVADSGIASFAWEQGQIDQALPCALVGEAPTLIPARWHPTLADPDNQPDLAVADGRLTVPLLHVWNQGDPNVCGFDPMDCALPDGSVVVMASADCVHEPMRLAIASQGLSSRSANLRVCVDNPAIAGACDKHVVTTNATAVNTDPAGPADYNAFALAWVRLRLGDD